MKRMKRWFAGTVAALTLLCMFNVKAEAVLLTDPNDPRFWQGANVGTFAALYYGSNTLANRQLVIDNQLLDDGIFDPTGYISGVLLSNPSGGGCTSWDLTGTGSYGYTCYTTDAFTAGNTIDNLWFQSSGTLGATVFDLGFDAEKAAVFNSIDHGPMPQEAIESTVYLSDTSVGPWTAAVVERVWLEGFMANTGILWDGFTYAVGTGTSDTFRYASVIWGGPGSLISDGDNEINGIMGLEGNYEGNPTDGGPAVPEPATMALLGSGLLGFAGIRRKRSELV
jgi:hypothetical protein